MLSLPWRSARGRQRTRSARRARTRCTNTPACAVSYALAPAWRGQRDAAIWDPGCAGPGGGGPSRRALLVRPAQAATVSCELGGARTSSPQVRAVRLGEASGPTAMACAALLGRREPRPVYGGGTGAPRVRERE